MIYRIQTLYLFASILIYSIILFFLYKIDLWNPIIEILLIIVSVCTILSFLSICCFKKQKVQISLNKTNILLNISMNILLMSIYLYNYNYLFFFTKKILLFLFLCICNILLFHKSNKYINEDIKMINSMDRIR
ncbi:DUF4293 family protein [Blattabacterium cuenoti]|uniref:DUF4293 family protein n=1 Tax=Blattabacterium cuenoti TaxID=1653831 RepID=UPI00163C4E41